MEDEFKDIAATWDENPTRRKMTEAFLGELEKLISIDTASRLLEFGAGTGAAGLRLANKIHSIAMVDTSPAMLAVLREKAHESGLINVETYEGAIENISLPEASFDLILSLMAFHHVDDILSVLCHFRRLVKLSGHIVIADLMAEDGSFHGGKKIAHSGFPLQELCDLFAEASFKVEIARPYHVIQKPSPEGLMREYDQFVLLASPK